MWYVCVRIQTLEKAKNSTLMFSVTSTATVSSQFRRVYNQSVMNREQHNQPSVSQHSQNFGYDLKWLPVSKQTLVTVAFTCSGVNVQQQWVRLESYVCNVHVLNLNMSLKQTDTCRDSEDRNSWRLWMSAVHVHFSFLWPVKTGL